MSRPNWGVNHFFDVICPADQFGAYPAAFGHLSSQRKDNNKLAVEYKRVIQLVIARERQVTLHFEPSICASYPGLCFSNQGGNVS